MSKVAKTPQQKREPRPGRPGEWTKIICPVCGKEYLHSAKIFIDGKLKRIGLACPNQDYFEFGNGYIVTKK